MFARLGQGQIIDITKDCEFQWYQEPASCYAYLQVSSASGDFTDGETVTGQNSGATATVFSSYVYGGRVYVTNVSGTFQAGETISGSSSNQTATVDGFVPERSWNSTPNNITHGTFPDSIISKDIDDYLEWESTSTGSGFISKLNIFVPKKGIYIGVPTIGVGNQIDSLMASRYLWATSHEGGQPWGLTTGQSIAKIGGAFNSLLGGFGGFFGCFVNITEWNNIMGNMIFEFYQNDKGTFRWRIHNIRVLKLVI